MSETITNYSSKIKELSNVNEKLIKNKKELYLKLEQIKSNN